MVPLVPIPSRDVREWGGRVSGEAYVHIQSKESCAYTKRKLDKARQNWGYVHNIVSRTCSYFNQRVTHGLFLALRSWRAGGVEVSFLRDMREGQKGNIPPACGAPLRFWPGLGESPPSSCLTFLALGFLRTPSNETGAPGSAWHSGQNHSPSGTASNGGSKHFKW